MTHFSLENLSSSASSKKTRLRKYKLVFNSTLGNAMPCGLITIGCLCGTVAAWSWRVTAAWHGQVLLRCLHHPHLWTGWKASQIFRQRSTLGHVIYQMNGPSFLDCRASHWASYHETSEPTVLLFTADHCFEQMHLHTYREWGRHNDNNSVWYSLYGHAACPLLTRETDVVLCCLFSQSADPLFKKLLNIVLYCSTSAHYNDLLYCTVAAWLPSLINCR